jgi:hypothetical protein
MIADPRFDAAADIAPAAGVDGETLRGLAFSHCSPADGAAAVAQLPPDAPAWPVAAAAGAFRDWRHVQQALMP